MKTMTMAGLVAVGLAAAGSAYASPELAKKSGCMMCHATAEQKVGPAFKDIAARNKGKADAEATLVAKIKGGKEHPAVKANDDEVKKLVKWVLAM
jgi:cytochrome c